MLESHFIHSVLEKEMEFFYLYDNNNDDIISDFASSIGNSAAYQNGNSNEVYSNNNDDTVLTHGMLEQEFKKSCVHNTKFIDDHYIKYLKSKIHAMGELLNIKLMITIRYKYRQTFHKNLNKEFIFENITNNIIVDFTVMKNGITDTFRDEDIFFNNDNTIKNHINNKVDEIINLYKNFTGKNKAAENTDNYDLIIPAGLGGILAHEAIGHCLEADNFFDEETYFTNKLDRKITSNKRIKVFDEPIGLSGEKILYSDDGTPAERVDMVENGCLAGIMTNAKYQKGLNIRDTGNGFRSRYSDFIIPRMRKTMIAAGNDKEEDIINGVKKGILVTEMDGGSVIPQLGKYVLQIKKGILIDHGERVNLVNPFIFSGTVFDTLDRIEGIGNKVVQINATCNKKGQLKNVVYGSPMLCLKRS